MPHSKQPSLGLNVGEGFPTAYSSFAVDASSQQQISGKAKQQPSTLHKRKAPSDAMPVEQASGLASTAQHTRQAVSARLASEIKSKSAIRPRLIVAFAVISAMLVVCIVTIRSSRSAVHAPSALVNEGLPSRIEMRDLPQSRFARWAEAAFGRRPLSATSMPLIASLGSLEMPDYVLPLHDGRTPNYFTAEAAANHPSLKTAPSRRQQRDLLGEERAIYSTPATRRTWLDQQIITTYRASHPEEQEFEDNV